MSSDFLPFPKPASPQRVGLLAGAGRFPLLFAQAAQRQGHSVQCMGISGLVLPELKDYCDEFQTASLARLGHAIRFFRHRGVDRVVMAGKIEKRVLFEKFRWLKLLPDWRTIHMWIKYAAENKKDDTILLAVIREFARDHIQVESALQFCPELLVKHGFLTRRKPSPSQWKDVRFGWTLAKEMGRLDVGQTVVVNDTACIAVEAIEGTDECIRRAGQLCRRGGFTVVKVAKPQQDVRFDVPTVGLQTVQIMHEAGARVLAVEAGMTILLDEPAVIELANRFGIAIVSLNAEEVVLRAAA